MKYFIIVFNLLQKLNMFITLISTHCLEVMQSVGDDMVTGQYHTCCCWRSLNMHVTVAVFQTTQFWFWCFFLFSLFFRVGFPLFPVCWYLIRSEISLTLFWSHLLILFRLVEIMCWEVLNIQGDIVFNLEQCRYKTTSKWNCYPAHLNQFDNFEKGQDCGDLIWAWLFSCAAARILMPLNSSYRLYMTQIQRQELKGG